MKNLNCVIVKQRILREIEVFGLHVQRKKSCAKSIGEKRKLAGYKICKAHDANAWSYEENLFCLWKLEKLLLADESDG